MIKSQQSIAPSELIHAFTSQCILATSTRCLLQFNDDVNPLYFLELRINDSMISHFHKYDLNVFTPAEILELQKLSTIASSYALSSSPLPDEFGKLLDSSPISYHQKDSYICLSQTFSSLEGEEILSMIYHLRLPLVDFEIIF